MHKIFICSQNHYLAPFKHLFEEVFDIKKADVVMFTGGADVSPFLYGQVQGIYTNSHRERDEREVEYANYAINHGIPMLGICRGSQFLTVMAGGSLIQDVTGHCEWHNIEVNDEFADESPYDSLIMSSTHHQMMHPYELDMDQYNVLAFTQHRSKHYWDGRNESIPHSGIEPEIVWYPKIKALAIQGHPEIMGKQSEGVKYCQSLVKDYLCV